jgi:hypothetical protein
MRQPQTPREALTLALFLAITADTEERTQMAIDLANELASMMHPDDIRAAKLAAKRRAAKVLQ